MSLFCGNPGCDHEATEHEISDPVTGELLADSATAKIPYLHVGKCKADGCNCKEFNTAVVSDEWQEKMREWVWDEQMRRGLTGRGLLA